MGIVADFTHEKISHEKKLAKKEDTCRIRYLNERMNLLRDAYRKTYTRNFQGYSGKKRSFEYVYDDLEEMIITPKDIVWFCQHIEQPTFDVQRSGLGIFLTGMVQKSYNEGHNSFTVDVRSVKEVMYIGDQWKGTQDNPLKITLLRDPQQREYNTHITNCSFLDITYKGRLNGHVSYFGNHSKNCTFRSAFSNLRRIVEVAGEGCTYFHLGQGDQQREVFF